MQIGLFFFKKFIPFFRVPDLRQQLRKTVKCMWWRIFLCMTLF